jgi:hypothetical protein
VSVLPLSRRKTAAFAVLATAVSLTAVAAVSPAAQASRITGLLLPNNLVVTRVVYGNDPTYVRAGVTQLPPGCTTDCVTATTDGSYPYVWNNELVDATFGVTARIQLDQITPGGRLLSSIEVPNSTQHGVTSRSDQVVSSFSSKSELAINLSTSGRYLTFVGYAAPVGALDESNANTPGVIDPTNPDTLATYRVVGQVDAFGRFTFTDTNAYSGDNGRAAILNDSNGADVIYAAGNAGNGGNPQPNAIITSTGAQIITPAHRPMAAQNPGAATPVGSFNITQLGDKIDKVGKDTNFRGLTIANNVVYYTKGSGSNGVNTVYFLDTTGTACPTGIGVPSPTATLPTSALAYDPNLVASDGVTPYNMCILRGFPTALKSTTFFPYGVWFANATTAYVADEGDGDVTYDPATNTYSTAATQTGAGLQKWVYDTTTGSWNLAYTLQTGLHLGTPYTVPGYPSGDNTATGLPWSPATDGLRNLTGRVNRDGTATIWAVTSTVSGSADPGADPNKLVAVTDTLAATSSTGESFSTVRSASFGNVLRGVAFTPGTRRN